MTHLALLWTLSACIAGAAPPAPPVDLNLRDAVGKTHRLADYRERKVVVVVFLAVDCPLAKLYTPRLVDLAKEYDTRGVAFLLIASGRDTPRDIARYARLHGVTMPVLRDSARSAARRRSSSIANGASAIEDGSTINMPWACSAPPRNVAR